MNAFRSARTLFFLGVVCVLWIPWTATVLTQSPPPSWLDRPLTGWNKAGGAIPAPPAFKDTIRSIVDRCKLTPPRTTKAEQAVEAAGWIPFWNFDQQLVREDVEVIGGMRNADGMCRPEMYNLFVFVGDRFAGTLSPAPMDSRLDSSSGVVRLPLPSVTSDFARFTSTDPLCCPSSRVTVSYRIDRTPAGAVVVPVEVRNTRR